MKAGPKAAVLDRGLPMASLPAAGGARVVAWIEKYVITPKGSGARKPMRLRAWQKALICSAFDEPRPRMALWSFPRGQGKTTLAAALGLYALHSGEEGAHVSIVAVDERQAMITLNAARRMTELSKPLLSRTQVFQNRLYVPRTGSTLQTQAATPASLEGLDPSVMIIDEIGVVDRRTFEVAALASGKRAQSLTLMIGTPSPDPSDSVMADLRRAALDHPDPSFVFREFAAPDGCAVDDEDAWAIANPALDDFLHRDAMRALLPPKTRESSFRRARLGMWIAEADDSYLPAGSWAKCGTGEPIPLGADVVLGLDGSYSGDSTALVAATISEEPHFDVLGHWAAPAGKADWRVDILDVENAVRRACVTYQVRECAADPFRWQRSLTVLQGDSVPMSEYPQNVGRMSPPTVALREAILAHKITHSGHPALIDHFANARVKEDIRGMQVRKSSHHSDRKIDLCVAAIMAYSRATHYAAQPQRKARVVSWVY